MEIKYLIALERERAEYGLRTLKQLKQELEHSSCGNQFKKYPFEIGGLSWITREIKREEAALGDRLEDGEQSAIMDLINFWHFPTIQQIAYKVWEEAGRPDNRSLDFWLEAERIYYARCRSIPRDVP
jgi:hypothetical protein